MSQKIQKVQIGQKIQKFKKGQNIESNNKTFMINTLYSCMVKEWKTNMLNIGKQMLQVCYFRTYILPIIGFLY